MGVTGLRSAAEIVVEGRVQGVGYRDFVQRKAASLGLAGYVMNLKDGKVRVRVEGGRDLIEELISAFDDKLCGILVGRRLVSEIRLAVGYCAKS